MWIPHVKRGYSASGTSWLSKRCLAVPILQFFLNCSERLPPPLTFENLADVFVIFLLKPFEFIVCAAENEKR